MNKKNMYVIFLIVFCLIQQKSYANLLTSSQAHLLKLITYKFGNITEPLLKPSAPAESNIIYRIINKVMNIGKPLPILNDDSNPNPYDFRNDNRNPNPFYFVADDIILETHTNDFQNEKISKLYTPIGKVYLTNGLLEKEKEIVWENLATDTDIELVDITDKTQGFYQINANTLIGPLHHPTPESASLGCKVKQYLIKHSRLLPTTPGKDTYKYYANTYCTDDKFQQSKKEWQDILNQSYKYEENNIH